MRTPALAVTALLLCPLFFSTAASISPRRSHDGVLALKKAHSHDRLARENRSDQLETRQVDKDRRIGTVASNPITDAAGVAVMLGTLAQALLVQPSQIDIGFNLTQVANTAAKLSKHSWEYGTTAQSLMEVFEADSTVFGRNNTNFVFPFGRIPVLDLDTSTSLQYARKYIQTKGVGLSHGDGSSGDPASLGVAATLLGATNLKHASVFQAASKRQLDHLLLSVPRAPNGAISHREDLVAIWADWMAMVPPFIAAQAVAQNDKGLMQTALDQITKYRQILRPKDTSPAAGGGAWMHIVGAQAESKGIWTTGNGWALNGMTRVLSSMAHWPATAGWADQQALLAGYIMEIFDAVQNCFDATANGCVDPSNKLLRGYLIGGYKGASDDSKTWPGEVAGTSSIASAIYRMAVLRPDLVPADSKYVAMADALRKAVAARVDPKTGIATPVMDPYAWWTPKSARSSPEGQAFIASMGSAYRDCIQVAVCTTAPAVPS